MSKQPANLYILDAFALIYRAYFAFIRNPLINSKGQNTSATTGFINTLWDILNREKPSHIMVAFDSPGPTFRAQEFEFYKANREEMPEDLRSSIPYIKRIVKGFNIPMLELKGFEADDIIGTIAKKAEQDGVKVYMVSADKDLGQLVSDNIFLYRPAANSKPIEIMGPPEIKAKWDIERVDQLIDILGLMGDASDNIPGIKGVGEKTAIKLLKQFDNIENLLKNTDQLKGKLKEKVERDSENAIISKKLATIVCDVPVEYDLDSYIVEKPNKEALAEVFEELEFRGVASRILGAEYMEKAKAKIKRKKQRPVPGTQLELFGASALTEQSNEVAQEEELQTAEKVAHQYHLVNDQSAYEDLLKKLNQAKIVAFDTETTSLNPNEAELVGMSFCIQEKEAYYVPVPADQTEAQAIVNQFKPFFENEEVAKIGQNIKYDMLMMKWYGVEVKGILEDTMIAHFLLEPDMRHNMDLLSETYLNYRPISIESLIGKKGKNQGSMRDVPLDKVTEYAAEDADLTLQLHQKFNIGIQKDELKELYYKVEMPLVRVLADMEYEGVALDTDFLSKYSIELGDKLEDITAGIYKEAGVTFNMDSPKQLGEVLFDKMEIPYSGKKTKTGQYSTNEETLTKLALEHDIINQILEYRELTKLKNTYVDAIPQLINSKTGRIHTTFNQTVASTGRLSSANPNLQNIPIRRESGKMVRKAFIARDSDHILLAADYSQIELRIIAALSEDEHMIAAFKDGLDIHSATASRVYDIPLEEVTGDLRRKAKMVNFGIIYGISGHGLGQRLGIKRKEAGELIKEYFKQYPKIKAYMDAAGETARENGYVKTILGRRRYLRNINSANHNVRQFAERLAINTPIQGSAADMIKVAMINVHREMKALGLQSKMTLQVHDELLFDTRRDELDTLKELVIREMQNAIQLNVPIEVSVGQGENWLEAH